MREWREREVVVTVGGDLYVVGFFGILFTSLLVSGFAVFL